MFTWISLGSFPDKNMFCVYFLKKDGEIVYVGQTMDMKARVYKHNHSRYISFDSVEYTITNKCNVNNLETYYILKYKPFHNSSLPANDDFKPVGNLKASIMEHVEMAIINKSITIGKNYKCKYVSSKDYNKIISSILIALSE